MGWITVLDSVPDIEMLDWLPQFLEGLFDMLSDGNREIRQVSLLVLVVGCVVAHPQQQPNSKPTKHWPRS